MPSSQAANGLPGLPNGTLQQWSVMSRFSALTSYRQGERQEATGHEGKERQDRILKTELIQGHQGLKCIWEDGTNTTVVIKTWECYLLARYFHSRYCHQGRINTISNKSLKTFPLAFLDQKLLVLLKGHRAEKESGCSMSVTSINNPAHPNRCFHSHWLLSVGQIKLGLWPPTQLLRSRGVINIINEVSAAL